MRLWAAEGALKGARRGRMLKIHEKLLNNGDGLTHHFQD